VIEYRSRTFEGVGYLNLRSGVQVDLVAGAASGIGLATASLSVPRRTHPIRWLPSHGRKFEGVVHRAMI